MVVMPMNCTGREYLLSRVPGAASTPWAWIDTVLIDTQVAIVRMRRIPSVCFMA